MSFNSLKKQRDDLSAIAEKLEAPSKKFQKDERYWYPKIEDGVGYAIIRFMPAKENESLTYVQRFSHGFKGKSGWYMNECPTTQDINGENIGKCPVCENNTKIWNELGDEAARKIISAPYPHKRTRQMKYTSNVYVVSDPQNPENEGKVFLFKYGKKIHDKILLAVKPEFPNDPKFNPFNLWTGANFELKIRTVDGQINYDSSKFQECAELADEETMEKAYNSLHSLEELISPDNYKSYEELQRELARALGESVESLDGEVSKTKSSESGNVIEQAFSDNPEEKQLEIPVSQEPETQSDNVDADIAYFQNLANASLVEDD